MKSSLLAIVALAAVLAGAMSPTAQAQYPKNVLIEQFTSATCGPCVPASPVMQRVMDVGKGTFVIKYHLNFPAPNDPFFLNARDANNARQTTYAVSGIPTARISGPNTIDPRNEQAVNNAVATQKAQTSSISMKVLDDKNARKARVRVFSPAGISGQRLFVAIVNRHASLPTLPQTLPGSNGMTDFYDAFLGFLTDNGGQQITVPANTTQEFEFSYNLGTTDVWNGEKYLMAWIQSGQNGAILQANVSRDPEDSTKLQFLNRSSVVASFDTPVYDRIARGASKTRKLTLRNRGQSNVSVSFDVVNQEIVSQNGWVVSVPQPVTLPPGETTTVDFVIQAPTNRSVYQTFALKLTASDGESGADPSFNVLVDGAKYVIYSGTMEVLNPLASFVRSVSQLGSRVNDMVIIPYADGPNAAYPVMEFDGAVYMIDYWANGAALGLFGRAGIVGAVKNLLAAGKSAWVIGEGEMTANFNQQSPVINQEAASFLGTTLGFNYLGGFLQFVNNNQLGQFGLAGVAGDPIGSGLNITGHTRYNDSWPTFQYRMDLFTLAQSSPSKSVLTINVNTQTGQQVTATVMARYESPQKGRLVFSTVSTSGLSDDNQRNTLVKRVFDWLFPEQAPGIQLSANSVNFNALQIGQTRDRDVTVTNTGNVPLEITGITISGGDASDFSIVSGGLAGSPITVQPGGTHRINLRFTPTAPGERMSTLLITSNASASASAVELLGMAQGMSVATDVVSETGAIGLRLTGANPVTTQSGIELSVRGTEAVTVSVVDANGRTVQTLFDGSAPERSMLTLDAAMLNSGMYTVVATNGAERAVLTVVVAR